MYDIISKKKWVYNKIYDMLTMVKTTTQLIAALKHLKPLILALLCSLYITMKILSYLVQSQPLHVGNGVHICIQIVCKVSNYHAITSPICFFLHKHI